MEKKPFIYNKKSYTAYDAQQIVFEACKYNSEITIEDGNKRGNAKSIIGLLSMRFLEGEKYYICADGTDEKEAADKLSLFIEKI